MSFMNPFPTVPTPAASHKSTSNPLPTTLQAAKRSTALAKPLAFKAPKGLSSGQVERVDLEEVEPRNQVLRDPLYLYNDLVRSINAFAVLEEQLQSFVESAHSLATILADLEGDTIDLCAGAHRGADAQDFIEKIADTLRDVRSARLTSRAHSLQCILAQRLHDCRSIGEPFIIDHIDKVTQSYANTDPYPAPLPTGKRSAPSSPRISEAPKASLEKKDVEMETDDYDSNDVPEEGLMGPAIVEDAKALYEFLQQHDADSLHITDPTYFIAPNRFFTLRKGGESDNEYWAHVINEFLNQFANSQARFNSQRVVIYKGGPDNAPFFIGRDEHHSQFAIARVKRDLAKFIVKGQ